MIKVMLSKNDMKVDRTTKFIDYNARRSPKGGSSLIIENIKGINQYAWLNMMLSKDINWSMFDYLLKYIYLLASIAVNYMY